MIISRIDSSAGFFSQFFFTLNHYIFCKKNKILFLIESTTWLFTYLKGWEDYFIPPENIENGESSINKIVGFFDILEEYPIYDYKNNIMDLYTYNSDTKNKIEKTKSELGLDAREYGSIFIRRGDKLFGESKLLHSSMYIDMLLLKYPECKIVYLQTDDYTCFEELYDYIQNKNLNIKLLTLCEKNSRGALISRKSTSIKTNIKKNNSYIHKIKDSLQNTTEVINMNPEQKYNHTMDMIIGVDIVLNSKICVCDYQSNVSRFIKLAHKDYDAVFDVTGIEIDLNKKLCPSYIESVYEDANTFIHS
jgi:hypothetical protein